MSSQEIGAASPSNQEVNVNDVVQSLVNASEMESVLSNCFVESIEIDNIKYVKKPISKKKYSLLYAKYIDKTNETDTKKRQEKTEDFLQSCIKEFYGIPPEIYDKYYEDKQLYNLAEGAFTKVLMRFKDDNHAKSFMKYIQRLRDDLIPSKF